MKQILLILFTVSVSVLCSCSDKKEAAKQSDIAPAQEMVEDGNVPESVVPPESEATENAPDSALLAGKKGPLNPPHGEPNHRCDIPVGAPLSSPPGTGPAITSDPMPDGGNTIITSTPGSTKLPTADNRVVSEKVVMQAEPGVTTTSSVPPPPNGTGPMAPGMNPPHGQPGHDCSVAVGAPLPKK